MYNWLICNKFADEEESNHFFLWALGKERRRATNEAEKELCFWCLLPTNQENDSYSAQDKSSVIILRPFLEPLDPGAGC